jgi:predicted nucleotidyltransferase
LRGSLAREIEGAADVVRAWLIGSLAWGGFGERSDIDLVVEGPSAPQALHLGHRVTGRLGVHVDVLRLEEWEPSSARLRANLTRLLAVEPEIRRGLETFDRFVEKAIEAIE